MDFEIKQKFPEKRNREYCKYNVSITDDKGLVQRIKVFYNKKLLLCEYTVSIHN